MKKIILIILMCFMFMPIGYAEMLEPICVYEYSKIKTNYDTETQETIKCKLTIDRQNIDFIIEDDNSVSSEESKCDGTKTQWLAPYDNFEGDDTWYYYKTAVYCDTICYDRAEDSLHLHNANKSCGEGRITLSPVKVSTTPEPGNKYRNLEGCLLTDYNVIPQCGCMPSSVADITSRLYSLIKIVAPALLIIVGGFDLIKAMSAQDEKAVKSAQQKLVRKFVAAAAVYLLLTIVQLLVGLLVGDNATNAMQCLDWLLNGYNV